MRLLNRYRRLSLWNRVGFWGSIASVVSLLITAILLYRPAPAVQVGIAFYAYEQAFELSDETKTYHWEMRNLVSNCQLWRAQIPLPKRRAETPEPRSWVLIKVLLENGSGSAITNLRIGIMSPLLTATTALSATPNVQAVAAWDSTSNDALETYVVSVASMAPNSSAVLSLQTAIDDGLRNLLYGKDGRGSAAVPFLAADQFATLRPRVVHFDAMELVQRETELRTGERTFADEKISFRMLRADEPNLDEQTSYQRLRPSSECPKGTGGRW